MLPKVGIWLVTALPKLRALCLAALLLPIGLRAQDETACPGFLPSRLVVGARGRVLAGEPNNVRITPSTNSTVLDQIPAGGVFTVLEGPECAPSIAWWRVDYNGIEGWTAEGEGDTYWVEPSLLPELEPITAENANRLQPLAILGVDLIHDVAWSPDGERLAVAGSAGLWLYNLDTPDAPALFEGYEGFFRSVAYSRTFIATGNDAGTIRLWNPGTRQEMASWQAEGGSVETLVFSPDGTLLASGSGDGTVQVWNIQEARRLASWTLEGGPVSDTAFSPDGSRLVVGSPNGASVFSLADGQTIDQGFIPDVASVAFNADGSVIAIASLQWIGEGEQTLPPLTLWNARTGERLVEAWIGGDWPGYGYGVTAAFGAGDTLLVNTGDQIIVWQADDLLTATAELGRIGLDYNEIQALAPVSVLPGGDFFAPSPDLQKIAIVSQAMISVVELNSGQAFATLRLPFFESSEDGRVYRMAFSPTEPLLAFGSENIIHLWDVETGLERSVLRGHEVDVHGLMFSPDGRRLASGSGEFEYEGTRGEEGNVRIWDTATGMQQVAMHHGDESDVVFLLTFTPGGDLLASSANWGNAGGDWHVWQVASGQPITSQHLPETGGGFIAFSPTANVAAISNTDSNTHEGRLWLWDINKNVSFVLFEGQDQPLGDVLFNPNGRLLAATVGNSVYVWDAQSGAVAAMFDESGVAGFSPDGSLLAYWHEDSMILWDTQTRQEHAHLTGINPSYSYDPVFFNPDGTLLYIGGEIWDIEDGTLVTTLNDNSIYTQHMWDLFQLAGISADGKVIAFSYGSGVYLWGVPAVS